MKHPQADSRGWLAELDTPPALQIKCEQMRAEAPLLGLGFHKGRLAPDVHERLSAHFRSHVASFRSESSIEEIGTVERSAIPALLFEDAKFNLALAEELRPMHESWAGMPLVLSDCYGIRCYQRGTYLHKHVDRQPHFVSATICVDQELDSPWPLYIESNDGEANQVHLEPGEFVMYEGARLVHGRPYPLNGDFYAGIFIHYRPADGASPTR